MSGVVRPAMFRVPEAEAAEQREETRNLSRKRGLIHSESRSTPRLRLMSSVTHVRHAFSMPKDYMHRRRFFRRINNVLLITLLSGVAGYVISRPTGGTGFRPPKQSGIATTAALGAETQPKDLHTETTASGITTEGYKLNSGPFRTSELADLIVHDRKRNKDIHVRMFYPREAGPFPVVVFSHGAGGSQNCCEGLTQHWASYGYVVIQPTHEDSVTARWNSGEEGLQFMPAVRDALKKPSLWESRPEDISAILDALPEMGKIPEVAGKLDRERVGVGGHSMGSFTAEAVAGALVDLPGHPGASFADPRVKAVLCLSPQGPGQFGLSQHSFDNMRLPYLGITGSLDSSGPVTSPAWHRAPFEQSAAGDKYHLLVRGANHMSFITEQTTGAGRTEQAKAILGYTNSAALAFWDAYLKNDARAKEYLQTNALVRSSKGSVQLFRR